MPSSTDRKGSSQADIRQRNRSLALAMVAQRGSLTRSSLTQATGLTRPAVSRIVADLVATGLLTESAPQSAGGPGRPTSPLTLTAGRHLFFGVDVRLEGVLIQARDLAGTLLSQSRHALPMDIDAAATADLIAAQVGATAQRLGRAPDGVGLAVGAHQDADNQIVVSSIYRPWRSVPLPRMVAERLGPTPPPVLMSDVASCAALASWQELAADPTMQDLAHLQIGIWSGSGYVQRLHGVGHVAPHARIAHIPLVVDGRPCACGARGCFDAEAGFQTLVERAHGTGLIAQDGPRMLELYCDRLTRMADDGHPVAIAAIDEMADRFAQAAAILINVLLPSRFTYGGYPVLLGPRFARRLLSRLGDHVPDLDTILATTSLGDRASVMGAYWLAVGPLMTDPELTERSMPRSPREHDHPIRRATAAR